MPLDSLAHHQERRREGKPRTQGKNKKRTACRNNKCKILPGGASKHKVRRKTAERWGGQAAAHAIFFEFLRGQKILEVQKYLFEAYYFDKSSPKSQNMHKDAQICAAHISPPPL
jgi:hypothetical protein